MAGETQTAGIDGSTGKHVAPIEWTGEITPFIVLLSWHQRTRPYISNDARPRLKIQQSTTKKVVALLVLVVVCLLFHFLDHRLPLRDAGIQIMLGNLFMHQILVAINTGGAFALHLRMCCLG